jgi:lantibiotic modifying enzyme
MAAPDRPDPPPARDELSAGISRRDAIGRGSAAAALLALRPLALGAVGREAVGARRAGPGTAAEYRDAALAAERWIARSAIRARGGLTWPADPSDPASVQDNLYSGSPGVVLFYLELARATGDRRWLGPARDGARYLAAGLPAASALGDEGHGLYTGIAGVAYVLELVQAATGDAAVAAGRDRAVSLLRETLAPVGAGAAWNGSADIIAGSSGIALTIGWLDRRGRAWPGWRADAVRVGDRLLEVGIPKAGGLTWAIASGEPRRYPNFSHGAAGVSYTLATLARETGERRFLEGALAGERYLRAVATRTAGDGLRVFHSEPGGEDLFYLSWCHGPAGTARLYHRLAEVTADAAWRGTIPQLAQAIVDGGVPEVHPDRSGFWNNVSQCCGSCGIAEFFVARHAATGAAADLAFAQRVMDDVLARGTADGDGRKWIQAEHRMRPDLLVAQTGLMQGAAGVGLALLHLEGAMTGRVPAVMLPDTPW